jgi:hypothetical protein
MFATIFFNIVFRFVNFLSFVSAAWSSWRNSWKLHEVLRGAMTRIITRTWIFPRWKNLASWLIVRQSVPEVIKWRGYGCRPSHMRRPELSTSPRSDGTHSHSRTPCTRLSRLVQIHLYQRLFKVPKITYTQTQCSLCAACHRACRSRAHILPQQQSASSCALLAAHRRGAAIFSSS